MFSTSSQKLKSDKGIDILEDFIRARYLSMKTGTYRMFNLFNSTLLQTMEPENIQAILATKFNDYELGEARTGNFGQVIGHGIFTAERESWQHFRHQLKPQFTRDQVSDLESAERHVNILFKALPQENSEGWIENTDLKPFLYRFTMDVSTEFLFGHSVNSQSQILHSLDSGNTQEIQADKDFSDAMNYGQEIIASRSRLRSYWWLINPPKFKKAVKTLQTFADRFVVAALALPVEKVSIKEESEYGTKKQKFVLLNELVKETRDPIELRDQILHVLLAGRDTTSAMLSWALILLARHPEHYASLRAAVLEHFPSDGSVTPSFESLKACKQLTWVLHETLRLYPLVPINSRMATRDTVLPVGGGKDGKSPVVVKKGEQVAYAMYVLHRDDRYWGKDSEEFSPGRWEGRKIGWDFVPFSGGPRVCLGREFP